MDPAARLVADWRAISTDEEAREALQSRLVVLSRLMFWSFIALLALMVLLYRAYPKLEPARDREVYEVALIGLVMLGVTWRGVLVRRVVALRSLYAIDLFYALTTGLIFAFSTYVTPDLKISSTANILWSCFVVFLRVIVLPSTGMRTAIAGAATLAPMVAALTALSLGPVPQELPPEAAFGSAILVSCVVILLASIGSRIIYGLRRQVNAAIRLGAYTLDAKIGEGGNGAVYRARHALLRRPTAIKLVRPDRVDAVTLDRFEREVQHMSQLTHPNTVAVYDYGRNHNGVFYYAMEYLDGIDLEQLVARHGALPADRVSAILIQVCGALQEAHRRGIVHRDIKPGNIILCERGDVPDVAKVVDFGLVKELADGGTDRSGILGTPAYIAPELVTDPAHAGPAADLYALGAVGYFLLTGRRVFEGKTSVDVCVQHVTKTPAPPSQLALHVCSELDELILSCLAKQPAQRPESAAALAGRLRALPPAGNWSEADAQLWWTAFRQRATPEAAASLLTITVDLEQRERAG